MRCRFSSYTFSQLLFPPSQACDCSHGFGAAGGREREPVWEAARGWAGSVPDLRAWRALPFRRDTGMLMEQRQQAMWTIVRPTDPPAALLWAVREGSRTFRDLPAFWYSLLRTENHYPPRHKLDPIQLAAFLLMLFSSKSYTFSISYLAKLDPLDPAHVRLPSRSPLNCL